MTNEEKILEMLTQIQGTLTQVQTDLTQVKADQKQTDQRLDGLHQALFNAQTDLIRLKTYTFPLKDEQALVQRGLEKVQDELHGVKAYLELDVEKRFDAVNEGIDTILERLEPQDQMERRMETLEDDVVVLKTAVKLHTKDIAELKKAQ